MIFSNEVWNVAEMSNGSARQMNATDPRTAPSVDDANHNANALNELLQACVRSADVMGVLYFPPGRYYVGRPSVRALMLHGDLTGAPPNAPRARPLPDIQIPPRVTLRFAPGATIVPFHYQGRNASDPLARTPMPEPGRPEDDFKVRIEIQGNIEAGIQQIFDAVLQSREYTAGSSAGDLVAAGIIQLTRNDIRAIYPEWWGAAPPGLPARDEDILATDARRTTMALQEAIRVAHTRRGNGYAYFAGAPAPAPLPIVLTGRYVIDQELQFGERWRNAQSRLGVSGHLTGGDPDPNHPVNRDAFVLRGARPPSQTGAGAAAIVAHPRWFNENSDMESDIPVVRTSAGSGALLGVRNVYGWQIENITFDASFKAGRCLTAHLTDGTSNQMIGVEGCEFRHALQRLVHLGGEVSDVQTLTPTGAKPNETIRSTQYSSTQDMLGFRMVRCRFDTGGVGDWNLRGAMPNGVMCRAGNTLFFAFRQCAFVGVAAPMIHDVEGGTSFVGCFFDTKWLQPPQLPIVPIYRDPASAAVRTLAAGVDILLDIPALQADMFGVSAGRQSPPSCFLKDTVSRSPILISSFRTYATGNPMTGSVLLINVEHIPTITPGDPLPPAILWAGITAAKGRLALMGCRFVRPATQRATGAPESAAVPYRFARPVGFDLWAFALNVAQLSGSGGQIDDWAKNLGGSEDPSFSYVRSSRGHVVDMGNQVDGADGLVSTDLVWDRVQALHVSDGDLAKVRALKVVEQHHSLVLGNDYWGRLVI